MSKENEVKRVDHRHSREKEQLVNRLKRIEGQVRGIQNMIETDRYCVDILIQIAAINAAMKKVSLQLMENHTKHCVADAIQRGDGEEAISELMDVVERLTKT
ncbi:metal-sensing transcriptional repressor [Alkalihalobacillus deserti]|uniref:metal-sensing transcriptional repressor n=1 Tax=Alkalihalobacillus deserti TaxID=2879466 RepID=UPI001D133565|nr:metal-sensing transcriptional repressor [Alkalihalobacillus deserti]